MRCVMDVRFGVYKAGKGAKKFGSREVLYVMRHPLALVVSEWRMYDVYGGFGTFVGAGLCEVVGGLRGSGL